MSTRAIYEKIIYIWITVKSFFVNVLVTRCFTYVARLGWQILETAGSHKGLGRKMFKRGISVRLYINFEVRHLRCVSQITKINP